MRIEAAGVNFLDIYYREGFHWGGHHRRPLPYTPGAEGAGRVLSVGKDVTEVAVGNRAAFGVSNGYGAYAEMIAIKSRYLVKLPDTVTTRSAAAVMQQGMTAHYLTASTYPLKPTDTALVHAAGGGTGLMLVQMAKLRNARVIALVSSAHKSEIVKSAGCDRRRRRQRRLRFGRQGYVRTKFELPRRTRNDGPVRTVERTRAGFRYRRSQREGLVVSGPSEPDALRCEPRRPRVAHVGHVRLDGSRQVTRPHRPDRPAS